MKKSLYRLVCGGTFLILVVSTLLMSSCTSGAPAVADLVDPTATGPVASNHSDTQSESPAETHSTQLSTPVATMSELADGSPAPTAAAPVTATVIPTSAHVATTAPTMMPTTAPTQSPSPTVTPKPSPTTEPGRGCPETPPLKPVYNRFYLSAKKWPQPDETVAPNHFWLSNPLPRAGRVLINQRFPYGWDENGRLLLHTGVDIAEDLGTSLLAVADGTVVVAQSDYSAWYGWRCDWYGHLVVIELDERWQDQPIYVLYGHILNITVESGQRVIRGQEVAEVGVGGAATHPHLHFEVRVGENEFSQTRNPILWIDPGQTRGVIAGRLVDPEGRPWQGVPLALVSEDTSENILPTWSYLGDPDDLMNPDERWAENFVYSDIPPGDYQVVTQIQGVQYSAPVQVIAGEVSAVEIITEAYKTPTPEPLQESTPEPTPAS